MERVPMGEGILGGIRIVEIAGGHALSVTGLLLAEAGAEVIKVEADAGARGSASFAVWNRSKKSVGLAIEGEEARRSLGRLLRAADVVLTDWSAARQRGAGLEEASMARRHPHLIHASNGSRPAQHPHAHRPVEIGRA